MLLIFIYNHTIYAATIIIFMHWIFLICLRTARTTILCQSKNGDMIFMLIECRWNALCMLNELNRVL